MEPQDPPEILRVPLQQLCLQIKLLQYGGILSFLTKAIQPPSTDAIQAAVSTLTEFGALNKSEELTPLGYHLANLPVDIHIGKLLLFGAVSL
jgi:HrpA-like RNA helicase